MPDLDDMQNNPYCFLKKISTEELKRILQEDFKSDNSDDSANDEFITSVMEVIAQRESQDSTLPQFDVDAGWNDFQKHYRPTGKNPILMCDEKAIDEITKEHLKEAQALENIPQPKRVGHRILRVVLIAAIIACMCAVAASAFEINIFKMFAQWTQDIFQFQPEMNISQSEAYEGGTLLDDDETLQGLLAEQSVFDVVSPTWIPEGFILSEISAYSDADPPTYVALYEDSADGTSVIVSVIVHQTPAAALQEKDNSQVRVYESGGVEHYIMENNEKLVATWFTDNLECSITGEISEEDLETMINSIYEE